MAACCLCLREVMRLHFSQSDWTIKTLNVTGIGLVIELLTKQRTTAVSQSDKRNLKLGYMPRVQYVVNLFVAGLVAVEAENAHICAHVQPSRFIWLVL